jgi:hypothetical protein
MGSQQRLRRAGLAAWMAHLAYRKTPAHDPRFAEQGLMSSRLLVLPIAAAMLLQTGVGDADAVDGDWCSTDGMRMAPPHGKHQLNAIMR